MAVIARSCPDCRAQLSVHVHERVELGRLRWGESIHCSNCGMAQEACGADALPSDLRDALLAQEGQWSLDIVRPAPDVASAARLLRTKLDLTMQAALALVRTVGREVRHGTRGEMQLLLEALAACGVEAQLRRDEQRR